MKAKDITPGDLLVTGRRDELKDGVGGTVVIALAVGHYVSARQPCGVVAVQNDRASACVVIAQPVRRTDNVHWAVATVSASVVMHKEVYDLKHQHVLELIEMDRAHERRGTAIEQEILQLVVDELGPITLMIGDLSFDTPYLYRGARELKPESWGPEVTITTERLLERLTRDHPLLTDKVNVLKDRYLEWAKEPKPSTCER